MRCLALYFLLMPLSALAHEYWLEPLDYMIQPGGQVQADLINGQEFEGTRLAYLPRSFSHFEMGLADRRVPIENRLGARPPLDAPALGAGLHVISYVSRPARLTYTEFDKFLRFAAHKDFPTAEADHLARGLSTDRFVERYTRFAKTLVAVGDGAGQDRRVGLETEIVALDNPYTSDAGDGIRVQLFYGEMPRSDAQIELFEKGPDDAVTISLHRTDSSGIATLPVRQGHSYLVDAVILRQPVAPDDGSVWETLWAALTFEIPS